MITPERSSLGDDTIEECELLRNRWLNCVVLPSNTMECEDEDEDEDEDDEDNLLDLEGVRCGRQLRVTTRECAALLRPFMQQCSPL